MKIGCAVVFMLMLGAATLGAQSASQQKGPTTLFNDSARADEGQQSSAAVIVPLSMVGSGCPVSMRAQHLSDGSVVKTGSGHPKGMGQWLHLTLTSPETKQIASALLMVRGVTPKGRVMKTESGSGGDADATRSVRVSFSAGADRTALADLWVPGMTAVESIALQSVEYSDGSIWRLAESTNCQVKPDPLMLITSR